VEKKNPLHKRNHRKKSKSKNTDPLASVETSHLVVLHGLTSTLQEHFQAGLAKQMTHMLCLKQFLSLESYLRMMPSSLTNCFIFM